MITMQLIPLYEIWTGFPSPWDVFLLTTLMFLFPNFPNPFASPFLFIYSFPLMGLS